MAGSVNRAILIGNVGKAPESRTTQSGQKVVNFSVATSESWNDKASGERKERTEWHRIVVMNDHLADVAEKYVHKGSKVYVEGQIQTRKWTDKEGVEKYSTEIMLGVMRSTLLVLDKREDAGTGDGYQTPARTNAAPAAGGTRHKAAAQQRGGPQWDAPGADLDDEIPF